MPNILLSDDDFFILAIVFVMYAQTSPQCKFIANRMFSKNVKKTKTMRVPSKKLYKKLYIITWKEYNELISKR